jgi:hypothetical protein
MMSIKRECIEAGFVVTFRQYGEFVGHEFFLTRSEMLEQLDDYREAGFTSLEVVGIRHRGRYLSPGAVAVVLDQETWYPPSALRTQPRRTRMFTLLFHYCVPDRNRELRPMG